MITDEEIEKAAAPLLPTVGDLASSDEHHGFIKGAKWMRERCGLQWKKPSEEMPSLDKGLDILVCCEKFDKSHTTYQVYNSEKTWDNDEGEKVEEKEIEKCLAWAYIDLPDWLK